MRARTICTLAIVLVPSLAAAGSLAAGAVRKVKIEKGIRLKDAGTPGLYEFGRKDLRIYYNSSEFGLATAESKNGKRWKKAQSTGIHVADSIIADASVIMWDGALRLFFKVVPFNNQDSHQVWRATATDAEGTEWEVDGRVYKRVGNPCLDWTSVPHAVVTHDDRVRLYFVCSKAVAQIATAVSNDGEKFKFEQIVLPQGVDPYVVKEGDAYRMFYAAVAPGGRAGTYNAIYSATSDDGLSWGEGELIVTAAELNVEATIDPAAYVFRKGRYRVYVPTSTDLLAGADFDIYSVQYTPSTFAGRSRPSSPWLKCDGSGKSKNRARARSGDEAIPMRIVEELRRRRCAVFTLAQRVTRARAHLLRWFSSTMPVASPASIRLVSAPLLA